MEIGRWFVGINILRDATLAARFAETARGEVRLAVLGDAVGHADTGTSLVLSTGCCRIFLLLLLLLLRRFGGRGGCCGGAGRRNRWSFGCWPFIGGLIGRALNTAFHAGRWTLHIFQDVVADDSGQGMHAHARTVLGVGGTGQSVEKSCWLWMN